MKFNLCYFPNIIFVSVLIIGCSETAPKVVPATQTEARPRPAAASEMMYPRGGISLDMSLGNLFGSPEDVFAEIQSALANKDYRRAAAAMTRESQAAVAGTLLFELNVASAKDEEMAANIEVLLDRYDAGEDEDENSLDTATGSGGAADTMRAMGGNLKRPSGFIAVAINLLEGGHLFPCPEGALTNLKIDGDKATGEVIPSAESPAVDEEESAANQDETDAEDSELLTEEEPTEPTITDDESKKIEFRNVNGGWLIHLPDDIFEQSAL